MIHTFWKTWVCKYFVFFKKHGPISLLGIASHSIFSLSLGVPISTFRNKISRRDLSTMYPPDVLNYCIQNNLLGRILTDEPLISNGSPSSYPPPPPQQHLPPSSVTSGSAGGGGSAYHPPSHTRPMHPSSHPPPPYRAHPVPPPPPGVYSHPGGPPPPAQPRKGRGGSSKGGSNRQMYSNSGIPNENYPLW